MTEHLLEPRQVLPGLDQARILALFGGSGVFGHERANMEIFRTLSSLGARLRVMVDTCYGHQELSDELRRRGFDWTTAPCGYLLGKSMIRRELHHGIYNLYGLVATSLRVCQEARRFRPTHFYTTTTRFYFYAAPALKWLGVPLVYRAGDRPVLSHSLHRWLNRQLFANVSTLVCNSDFIRQRLVAAGAAAERIRVIHNYPPERSVESIPVLPGRPPEDVVVGYLGQLSEDKGVMTLIRACAMLVARGAQIQLWLAGKPALRSDIETRISEALQRHSLKDRIHLLGYVQNVSAMLRCVDVHVCPSLIEEASPNVILEAKREGVPSVGFPVGGIPELIKHKVDGYVCKSCSPESLADGLMYFIEDPEGRRRAGVAGRQSLDQNFGQERFCSQWRDVFLSSISATG